MNLAIPDNELPVYLRFARPMNEEQLLRFCAENGSYRVEQDATGEIIVMSPTGLEGSFRNSDIVTDLTIWARKDGRGRVFESNAGFTPRDGSVRAPDAAWVSLERWNALPREEQKKFGRIVPEFVIELRSESDRLSDVQTKAALWVENGSDLVWLVDPIRHAVEIYRPGQTPELFQERIAVLADGPVAGFVLDCTSLWA